MTSPTSFNGHDSTRSNRTDNNTKTQSSHTEKGNDDQRLTEKAQKWINGPCNPNKKPLTNWEKGFLPENLNREFDECGETDQGAEETNHSNGKTNHSNGKTNHSNGKTNHSNGKTNHSNGKTNHSNGSGDNQTKPTPPDTKPMTNWEKGFLPENLNREFDDYPIKKPMTNWEKGFLKENLDREFDDYK